MISIVAGRPGSCGRIAGSSYLAARMAPPQGARGRADAVPVAAVAPYAARSRVKGATARPNLRPRCASSRRGLAGRSIGAHALELLRNQRSPGGSPGARPDGVWVSMVLTSTPHRCCTPKKDCRISTILAGCFDGRLGSVGAVDTGPRRCESPWVLPQSPAPPSRALLHCSLTVVCAGSRWSWLDAGSALSLAPSRRKSVYSTRVGIHWPRVVRTARRPHLPEVPPTLDQ